MHPPLFRVSVSRWITEGWNLFLRDMGPFIVMGILSTVILSIFPFVAGPVWAAMAYAAICLVEKGRVTVGDYFDGYRFFVPALLASILITLFSFIGFIFFIIPGLVILGMYMFTFTFIAQDGQDFWTAMQSSRRVASHDYFGFTLFVLGLIFLNILGALFMFIGLFFTLPMSACAVVIAHREIHGLPAIAPEIISMPAKPVVIE